MNTIQYIETILGIIIGITGIIIVTKLIKINKKHNEMIVKEIAIKCFNIDENET